MSEIQAAIAKAQFPYKLACLFDPPKARYRVLYGGRGGAKSWGVARALLIKGAKDCLRIPVSYTHLTLPTNREV